MTIVKMALLVPALLVFAATPGPGNFAVVARALSAGMGAAIAMTVGIVLGDLLFLTAALAGVTAGGPMLGSAFVIVKYIGAAYLVTLGIRLWRQAPRSYEPDGNRERTEMPRSVAAGLLLTLGNPKVILFYLGFLPLFVDPDRFSISDAVDIAVVVPVTVSLPLLGYAFLAARVRRFGPRLGVLRALNRTAGTLLVGAGMAAAFRQ